MALKKIQLVVKIGTAVITRYPQFKADIDTILVNDGFQDLIVG